MGQPLYDRRDPNFFPSQIQIQPNPGLDPAKPDKIQQRKSFNFLRRIQPSQRLTPTPRAFFYFLRPFPALKAARAALAALVRPGMLVPLVLISGSSGLLKQVKGWRRFHDRGRLGGICVRPYGRGSLAARKEKPSTDQKPEDRDKTGRSIRRPAEIRPLERSPNRFRASTSGRAPALHAFKSISRTPAL